MGYYTSSKGRPVILACQNLNALDKRHAILLKGYSPVTFFVWNPWYTTYENIPIVTPLHEMVYVCRDGFKFEIYGYAA